jgi:hypothetical protein
MSTPRVIRVDDVPPQRWRNGGGWTRELLAWPTADDWRVRVSVADIESDGPFSSFPGVQRFFAVLEGAGVELTVDGRPQQVMPDGSVAQFAGGATTHCRLLSGPTRDLNLMVRGTHGAMARVVSGLAWQSPAVAGGLFALTAGRCRSESQSIDLDSIDVPAFSLLWFERAPNSLIFQSSGWWLAA